WQSELAAQWLDRERQGRLPHAVLLSGPPGVGKRAAAAWMVARKLAIAGTADAPQYPFERPEHADLHWVEVLEDKKSILIEQTRALVHELGLTSYAGRGKAAVIDPANLMNRHTANSLLKTLEEPPGDALLVLVADRSGRLPATILSRCQRIDVRVPAEAEGLEWLDRLQPGGAWLEPLRNAGFAPIGALQAAEQLELTQSMARDFGAVARGEASPIEVAATWGKLEPNFVVGWLARQVQQAIRAAAGHRESLRQLAVGESVLQRIDRRNLFCYLDTINRLSGQSGGSWNPQLTFEALLIDWATGLRDVR
ncbi:MAG: hypothetical protein R3358_13765, partial [Woeseiaceae bacterium]|nr:hypothetical protein [Woeseiaceae bacterium]